MPQIRNCKLYKRYSHSTKHVFVFVLYFLLPPAFAAQISVSLPNSVTANADFRKVDSNKPAVFILHGFMSTHNLNIIQNIADELESSGFTVLAPTLSLNINNRHSGASCEAAHTHTMETDVDEIRWWINWLESKGYQQIIVIGHSTGSLQLAIALSNHPPSVVKKAIFTAPAYLQGSPFPEAEEKADIAIAEQLKAKNDNKLHDYYLSYCKGNFVSPYNVFLSYKAWSRQRLIDTISKVSIPYTVILGEEDHRFGVLLNNDLKQQGSRIVTIGGADHFFSSPYEFDFLEKLQKELE
ncbi:alpha/beta hydrolase [Kaarinaea lacus]